LTGEGTQLLSNKWFILLAALVVWSAYFYVMDKFIMEAQGLPVQINLMPR
jgi:hypothetical protein